MVQVVVGGVISSASTCGREDNSRMPIIPIICIFCNIFVPPNIFFYNIFSLKALLPGIVFYFFGIQRY